MASLKFRTVGKPGLSKAKGDGDVQCINMPEVGRVKFLAPEGSLPDCISRNPNPAKKFSVKKDKGGVL